MIPTLSAFLSGLLEAEGNGEFPAKFKDDWKSMAIIVEPPSRALNLEQCQQLQKCIETVRSSSPSENTFLGTCVRMKLASNAIIKRAEEARAEQLRCVDFLADARHRVHMAAEMAGNDSSKQEFKTLLTFVQEFESWLYGVPHDKVALILEADSELLKTGASTLKVLIVMLGSAMMRAWADTFSFQEEDGAQQVPTTT